MSEQIMNTAEHEQLLEEIKTIARENMLPDGDGVNVSTAIWAESWWERADNADYVAWLRRPQ